GPARSAGSPLAPSSASGPGGVGFLHDPVAAVVELERVGAVGIDLESHVPSSHPLVLPQLTQQLASPIVNLHGKWHMPGQGMRRTPQTWIIRAKRHLHFVQ
ncbi:MAG: hypothetical protein RI897_3314, partial [Verrucomicrobiota bacterium]